MSDHFSVTRWIDQLHSDDDRVREEAVRKIWQHYSGPLLRMARAPG